MANERGAAVDRTYLSLDAQEQSNLGMVHRDYLAHCLRWSHVQRLTHTGDHAKRKRVLDLGCGPDLPLLRVHHQSRGQQLAGYVGVDASRLALPAWHTKEKFPVTLLGETDAAQAITVHADGLSVFGRDALLPLPDIVVCFEVVEHVEPFHARRLIRLVQLVLAAAGPAARGLLSTPCWDPHVGAAANHVSELTYQAMGAALEAAGLTIEDHWGTFNSQRALLPHLDAPQRALWDRLASYYHPDYLATVLAPAWPEHSRNCLWEVSVRAEPPPPRFPPLSGQPGPWTSSERWQELG